MPATPFPFLLMTRNEILLPLRVYSFFTFFGSIFS